MSFRGPMGLRGPIRGHNGLIGPIEMKLTNQFAEDHIKIRRKLGHFALKTFFFEITSKSGENWAVLT